MPLQVVFIDAFHCIPKEQSCWRPNQDRKIDFLTWAIPWSYTLCTSHTFYILLFFKKCPKVKGIGIIRLCICWREQYNATLVRDKPHGKCEDISVDLLLAGLLKHLTQLMSLLIYTSINFSPFEFVVHGEGQFACWIPTTTLQSRTDIWQILVFGDPTLYQSLSACHSYLF